MPYGTADIQRINNYIKRVQPNAPLVGRGADFVAAANATGVSPYALAAIARKESQFGLTSGKFRNNPMGYGVHLGPSVYTSPTWRAGILRAAKSLSGSLYKGAGLKTIDQVLMKYAPPSENATAQYIAQAKQYIQEAGGDPNASIFGDASGTPLPDPATANENAPAQGQGMDLNTALEGAIASRPKGQRLLDTVVGAVLSAQGQQAVSPRTGLKNNPSGLSPEEQASGGAAGAYAAAQRQLGTPYAWGGGGPGGKSRGFAQGANTIGFDCSSLMQYAYSKIGVTLPRTTYDQIKAGRAVNAKNMGAWQVGDLLFPSTGHVQMYIGNGRVIEAPRTGGHVQEVPVRSHYIAVRRVV